METDICEKDTIDVEIILKYNVSQAANTIKSSCLEFLKSTRVWAGTIISHFSQEENVELFKNVDHVIIGEHSEFKNCEINFTDIIPNWFTYYLDDNGIQRECEEDDSGNETNLASLHVLPAIEYFNLWENLIYESDVKKNLINYAKTALMYADRNVDENIISCNRVILLHGPPGTGKTSLCKALAQKLTIRLNHRFKRGFLMEINSHSLFSKYFSESGKMVSKMFARITEYVSDKSTIVFVLIDEVESLTHSRDKCSGNEPSDAIRVVNAVLTEIDKIKRNSNVLILSTSNLTQAIDSAFMDRADITQFIGLPEPEAIYKIYHTCILELMRTEIVVPKVVLPSSYHDIEIMQNCKFYDTSKKLYEISKLSVGLSGRALRKMPFLAHSLFIKKTRINIDEFYEALTLAVNHYKLNKASFDK